MTVFSLVLALTVSFDSCQTPKRVLFTFANSSKLVKNTLLHIALSTLFPRYSEMWPKEPKTWSFVLHYVKTFQTERQKAMLRTLQFLIKAVYSWKANLYKPFLNSFQFSFSSHGWNL